MPEDLNQNHADSVDSVEFRPADGGLVSETRGKLKSPGKGKSMIGPEYKHSTGVHTTLSSAVAHMKKNLAHHFAKKKSGETMKKKG